MGPHAAEQVCSEEDFASVVEELDADPQRRHELVELLEERHQVYDQRGARATVRMRGWLFVVLARHGLPDPALIYVLEELDTGRDPYLVAAAAHALRSRTRPDPAFAPYLVQAITNLRLHDDLVLLASYGAYGDVELGRSALAEVFASLRWLGPAGRGALPGLTQLLEEDRRGELPASLRDDVASAIAAIDGNDAGSPTEADCCGLPWDIGRHRAGPASRTPLTPVESMMFQDHDARHITFGEFFHGRPSVVAFFYTRCDNPRKCSLTIAKMGRLQRLLAERGIAGRVRTAAITYDPGWDLPDRLRGYGMSRGLTMDGDNRILRGSPEDLSALREHFSLGVNFIESLVNRHRVEAYVLDSSGRIAVTFERLEWHEQEVVRLVEEVLAEPELDVARSTRPRRIQGHRDGWALSTAGVAASLAAAFFPKCPACWAAYLSLFGIAGLGSLPYAPWLLPVMLAAMAANLGSLWLRGRATGHMLAFSLAAVGALLIIVLGMQLRLGWARPIGVGFTAVASLVNAMGHRFATKSTLSWNRS